MHLTSCVEQFVSENLISFELTLEIPRVSWNPYVYYHVQKGSSLVPILDLF